MTNVQKCSHSTLYAQMQIGSEKLCRICYCNIYVNDLRDIGFK